MSTIAYRDGVLAADSRVSDDWIMPHTGRKIERLPSGLLFAFSGNVYKQQAFLAWVLSREGEQPDLGDDSKAMLVRPGGEVTFFMYKGSLVVEGPFCALGGGAPIAIAAMHMGASARRAVEIAALVDPYTGGDIITLEL
jgi:hypothetical protein